MAIYYLQINPVSRSAGRRATASAAYRAGERIRDERSGRIYDHSRRSDVLHKEMMLPSRFDAATTMADRPHAGRAEAAGVEGSGVEGSGVGGNRAEGSPAGNWARDRAALWNLAERTEKRRNSRVAREYQVTLPFELAPAQRLGLARAFARVIADRYNVAVDLAIHAPRAGSDPRNYHAHLLTTTREITPQGLGAKTGLDMNGSERHRRGLVSGIQELVAVRARWAELANEALREAGLEARIDHRTLDAQGIDRVPRAHLPWAAYRLEQRGLHSEVAERIRERVREKYRARVAARLARTVEPASTAGDALPGPEAPRPGSMEDASRQAARDWLRLRSGLTEGAASAEDVRRQAAQDWLRLRSGRAAGPVEALPSEARDRSRAAAHEPQPQNPQGTRHGRHDDFAL